VGLENKGKEVIREQLGVYRKNSGTTGRRWALLVREAFT